MQWWIVSAVYTPLCERGSLKAVAGSNLVGSTAGSLLFLWLAFGSLAFIEGQLVGRGYMTALAVVTMWTWRNRAAVAAGGR